MTAQTVLTVGAGAQFATIGAAIQAANQMGGNADIQINAGTYTNDGGYLADGINNVTIEGVGGTAVIADPSYNADGKAAIVVGGQNILLKNLDISGVTVPDGNGAGIRYDQGTLTLDHVHLHNNQNGILGAPDSNGSITIQDSELDHNGTSAGNTHNIYIGDIAQFTLTDSYVHDANVGHEVKSRAENNTITNNVIADNSGTSSYSIDLPNGGNASITGNTIEQGANGQNHVIMAYGEEGNLHAGRGVTFSGNEVVNDMASGAGPLWANNGATITGSGNTAWMVNDLGSGVSPSSVTQLPQRPTIDTSHVGLNAAATASTPPSGDPNASPITPTTSTTLPGAGPASSPLIAQITNDLVAGDAYRFFSTADGTEFLSTSPAEIAQTLQSRPDLVFEGTAFATVTNPADPASASVFRFFDTSSGTHFYTASTTERDALTAGRPDLVYEGTSFNVDTTQQAGDTPVYRFFESTNGTHFYTASAAEQANIVATRPDMINEGAAFYVPGT